MTKTNLPKPVELALPQEGKILPRTLISCYNAPATWIQGSEQRCGSDGQAKLWNKWLSHLTARQYNQDQPKTIKLLRWLLRQSALETKQMEERVSGEPMTSTVRDEQQGGWLCYRLC